MKILRLLFYSIIPITLLTYIVMYTSVFTISVSSKLKQINSNYSIDSINISNQEFDLIKQKAFLEARLEMAKSDSMGLSLNLNDSILQIEMKGVALTKIPFNEFYQSPFFNSIHPTSYQKYFSKPFSIAGMDATVVKEPIIVKKAPKDTTEAALNSSVVEPVKSEFIEWHIMVDSLFIIRFIQMEDNNKNKGGEVYKYNFKRHYLTFTNGFKNIIRFEMPEYYPEIIIYIPAKESKAIYRALTLKSDVIMKI